MGVHVPAAVWNTSARSLLGDAALTAADVGRSIMGLRWPLERAGVDCALKGLEASLVRDVGGTLVPREVQEPITWHPVPKIVTKVHRRRPNARHWVEALVRDAHP